MPRIHLSFSQRRRRALRVQPEVLRLEGRNAVTPIGATALGLGVVGGMGASARSQSPIDAGTSTDARDQAKPLGLVSGPSQGSSGVSLAIPTQAQGGGGATDPGSSVPSATATPAPADGLTESLTFSANATASEDVGISAPWQPSHSLGGGGAAMQPRGGSGNGAQAATVAAIQGRSPRPAPPATPTNSTSAAGSSAGGGSAALLAAVASASASGTQAQSFAPASESTSAVRSAPNSNPAPSAAPTAAPLMGSGAGASGGTPSSSIPDPVTDNVSGPSEDEFPYFAVYVLDNNDGVVLFPGVDQVANLNEYVDLKAQVSGATVSSYSWNTSGISSDASSISGASTYNLTFRWDASNATAHTDSISLSVTDSSSQVETYTYDFVVPVGTGPIVSGGGNVTWPTTYAPNTISADDPAWSSDGVSVDSNSGALDAGIQLPSYNPNVPGLALAYDSQAANPDPIIIAENTLSASTAVPSQVAATLTFNGTPGTTYYYGASSLSPGDIQQVALQAGTGYSTGRYGYSMQVVDEYSSPTTVTYTGTATVLNESSSSLGAGWTLSGLEKITSASGGVILDEGGGDSSLWFTGSFSSGGTYTSPAGDFSTLVKLGGSGGGIGYTRTLPDGTEITFNSSGYETATIDRNGLHTTYSYNGSNQLTSVEDPYGGLTTFTYSSGGGSLQTIEDPAGRLTTFTFSGGNLQSVKQADDSITTYTYNGSDQITQVKDPLGNVVSVSYDSAGRVGTITSPDAATEEFSAYQEQGWTNSGTSGSPTAATLMAAAAASYTDGNGNTSTLRPDWYGLGQTGVAIDALGDVATYDINSNGLATVAIDPLNRITSYTYDSKGNVTEQFNPDGTTEQSTYNNFSEPLTYTNENSDEYKYSYDSHGNNTVIQDPMNHLTTMTYTSNGRLQTLTNADDFTTTYQYDSQDRLTTIINPDSTTEKFGYNNEGDEIQFIDERGNTTTFSYDALNRQTGTTDPLGNHTTTQYDADGNVIATTDGLGNTTSYAYDSMNQLTTVTTPLGYQTVYGYDADGNQTSATDPMGRITTTIYDALNRRSRSQWS